MESGEVDIGVFCARAPFSHADENGAYQGYDICFAERIGEDLEVKVNFVSTVAADRIEYLNTAGADIILSDFTVTEDRSEKVGFALP